MALQVYVSGDKGSAELCLELDLANVTYVRRDIRKNHTTTSDANLKHLLDHGLTMVPQVFTEGGMHIGGYEAGMSYAAEWGAKRLTSGAPGYAI